MRFAMLFVALFCCTTAVAQTTCPPDAPASRAWVDGYLRHSNFVAHRDSLGIHGLQPADVRLLTDTQDLSACQWMNATFGTHGSHPNWYWSAYQVGSYYVIAWRYVSTDGGISFGLTPMLIFDAQFRQVGGFAS